jgi:hypothetical protein
VSGRHARDQKQKTSITWFVSAFLSSSISVTSLRFFFNFGWHFCKQFDATITVALPRASEVDARSSRVQPL